jgi:FkbM family methyltransferase
MRAPCPYPPSGAKLRTAFKSWCLRHLPAGPLAWLHGARFAWLVHWLPQDPEATLLGALLRPGEVAVDVGANGANWTWFLSRAVGPQGRVFAFEADPYYARATACAIRVMGLGNVTFLPFGLSDRTETVQLRTLDPGGARLSGTSHIARDQAPGGGLTPVRLVPLDELRADHPELARTALIECDVEGYELPVLQGAEAMLRQARPVIIFEVGCCEAQGYTPSRLRAWLADLGYASYALDHHRRLVAVDADLAHPAAATVNRLALPREHMDELRRQLPFAGAAA